MLIRSMQETEWDAVAELIHSSTNHWYASRLGHEIFSCEAADCRLFADVYEALDPGCCLVAEERGSAELLGSCFYHPRETHWSLGIMNVRPGLTGRGVARQLLAEIVARAEADSKPLRLVSSCLNLDSFSLYTKAGFQPRALYQDMQFPAGIDPATLSWPLPPGVQLRPVRASDPPMLAELERRLTGLHRPGDHAYFQRNPNGHWHGWMTETASGEPTGFLYGIEHPASCMLGPGVMTDDATALALIGGVLASLRQPQSRPVFLVPVRATGLVAELYRRGARNLELHVAQVRGDSPDPTGIVMPTFMPETC